MSEGNITGTPLGEDVLQQISERFSLMDQRLALQEETAAARQNALETELAQARNERDLLQQELSRRTMGLDIPTATTTTTGAGMTPASPMIGESFINPQDSQPLAEGRGLLPLRTQSSQKEKIKLSEYKGTRSKWREWSLKAQAKLRIDGNLLTEQEKLWYLYSRLEDSAAKVAAPWMNTPGMTAPKLLAKLETIFGDPGLAVRALGKLRTLKQGDRGFGIYLSEFQQLLADAGSTSWSDDQKLNMLEGGVNIELLKITSVVPNLPAVFEDRTAYYQEVWDRLALANSRARETIAPARYRGHGNQEHRPGRKSQETTLTTATSEGESMDWVKTSKNHTTVMSNEERGRHMNEGLCFTCSRKGHRSRDCSEQPVKDKRTVKARKATTEKKRKKEEEDIDSASPPEDSDEETLKG
jgi:hypothetical protein